jgi:hypothetical protein
MKIITVNSNTHGQKHILVDDDDYPFLKTKTWCILKDTTHGKFYAVTSPENTRMHRLVMKVTAIETKVDHKNHNGLDNRKKNLRCCTTEQNGQNRRKVKKGSSRYKGVYFNKNEQMWRAHIVVKGKEKHLGYFQDERDAGIAYNRAAEIFFKTFSFFNKIPRWRTAKIISGKPK